MQRSVPHTVRYPASVEQRLAREPRSHRHHARDILRLLRISVLLSQIQVPAVDEARGTRGATGSARRGSAVRQG